MAGDVDTSSGNVDAKPLHQGCHGKKVAFSHGLHKIAMQLQPLSPDLGGGAAKTAAVRGHVHFRCAFTLHVLACRSEFVLRFQELLWPYVFLRH